MGEAWPAVTGLDVAKVEVIPYAADPMEVAACNMYQELLGFLVYRSFAKQVKFLKATSPYNQISGGPSNVLDHLAMGAFYFRKPEYEFFLRENEYLLGTDLRDFWDWYFKGVVEPCSFCEKAPYQCSCEHFEDGKPAPIKNPDWWKKVKAAGTSGSDPRIDVDAWAKAFLADRGVSRADARAPS